MTVHKHTIYKNTGYKNTDYKNTSYKGITRKRAQQNSSPPEAVAHTVQSTRAAYRLRRISVVVFGAVLGVAITLGVGAIRSESAVDDLPLAADDAITTGSPTPSTAGFNPESGPSQRPVVASGIEPQSDEVVEQVEAVADALPSRASRLVSQAPERMLDTREGAPLSQTDLASFTVGPDNTAVVLSVSLMASAQAGSVSIDGAAGIVEAVVAPGPNMAMTNLVIVPVVGTELSVRSSTGGHVVIDMIGSFQAPNRSTGGRLVVIPPVPVAELVTKTDGREATLAFGNTVSADRADAVLVAITADVGSDGGMVRLGPTEAEFDQMLMWGPSPAGNRTRRGLVLLRPGSDWSAQLRYDGGSVLVAEVIGYFTSDSTADQTQEQSNSGLYVPSGPRKLFGGVLNPGRPVVVDGIEPLSTTAFVTVTASPPVADGDFPGSALLAAGGGTVTLESTAQAEVEITLLGVFLGRS